MIFLKKLKHNFFQFHGHIIFKNSKLHTSIITYNAHINFVDISYSSSDNLRNLRNPQNLVPLKYYEVTVCSIIGEIWGRKKIQKKTLGQIDISP